MYDTETRRWQAIQARDRAASSSFVYAVISTKIYCRPGCPSRLARRANVCFYDNAEEAAAAGYRPCLRCKPDQATSEDENQQGQRDAVRRACEYIKETKGQAKFPDVAKHVGLSTRYLYGLFKSTMGTTPARYGTQFRLDGKVGTPLDTPSVASDALSFVAGEASEPLLDSFTWNALVDFNNANIIPFYESAALSLQHSSFHDDPLAGTMVDPKSSSVEDYQNPMFFQQNDSTALDLNLLDLVWDAYQ